MIDWLFRGILVLLIAGVIVMYAAVRNPDNWP